MLTRLLFRDLWGASPRFVEYPSRRAPDPKGVFLEGGEQLDAVLLIGDAALAVPAVPGWEVVDLGTEWTRWTGLPFVYAFWVWRGGLCPEDLVTCLLAGKREGLSRVDEIAEAASLPGGFDSVACRQYLNRRIQYDLGPLQIEGCLEFFARLERAGLIEQAPSSLAFLSEADATCSTESA
jgi:chorismate dehydratase